MITKINNWMLEKQVAMDVRAMEAEDGQTMVEYGLVLVSVAIAALVAYKALGTRVTSFLGTITF